MSKKERVYRDTVSNDSFSIGRSPGDRIGQSTRGNQVFFQAPAGKKLDFMVT
jgi:hypothetical protein